jgi:hypothetical protein
MFFFNLKTMAVLRMGNEKQKKTGMQGVTEIGVVEGWTKNYDTTFVAAKHCAENERNSITNCLQLLSSSLKRWVAFPPSR